jgi:AraC-like DNA-binding protein
MESQPEQGEARPEDGAGRYVVARQELDTILRLLYRLLDVRITFFDMQAREWDHLAAAREMSAYCAARRRRAIFHQRCVACDRAHLEEAKRTRDVLTYHCHDGLLEGIVPLYDKHGRYLGAVVFGQLRDPARPAPAEAGLVARRLYQGLQAGTPERVRDLGRLLKYVTESILEREVIRYRPRPWVEAVDRHVREQAGRRITRQELARLIRRSPSFLTQHFAAEFGCSLPEYVQRGRMQRARELLAAGQSVKDVAAALGFYDAFHFSKRFKQYWGVPPSRHEEVVRAE